jgi:hypothetical protein
MAGSRSVERVPETKAVKEKQLVERTAEWTTEAIIKNLAEVQVGIGKSLNDLSDKLIAESNKLKDLQNAITIQSEKLKQLYDIESRQAHFQPTMTRRENKNKCLKKRWRNINPLSKRKSM